MLLDEIKIEQNQESKFERHFLVDVFFRVVQVLYMNLKMGHYNNESLHRMKYT